VLGGLVVAASGLGAGSRGGGLAGAGAGGLAACFAGLVRVDLAVCEFAYIGEWWVSAVVLLCCVVLCDGDIV